MLVSIKSFTSKPTLTFYLPNPCTFYSGMYAIWPLMRVKHTLLGQRHASENVYSRYLTGNHQM